MGHLFGMGTRAPVRLHFIPPFLRGFFRSPPGSSCYILTLPIQFLRSRDLDLVAPPHQLIPLSPFVLCTGQPPSAVFLDEAEPSVQLVV